MGSLRRIVSFDAYFLAEVLLDASQQWNEEVGHTLYPRSAEFTRAASSTSGRAKTKFLCAAFGL